MRDLIVIIGGCVALAFGIVGALRNEGTTAKAGALVAAGVAGLGMAYFGWRPFFGGSHEPGTYFGCIMLVFGIYAWLRFFSARR